MDPGDPRTLDPYRYADNNPVSYTDATGLCSALSGAGLDALMQCGIAAQYAHNALAQSRNTARQLQCLNTTGAAGACWDNLKNEKVSGPINAAKAGGTTKKAPPGTHVPNPYFDQTLVNSIRNQAWTPPPAVNGVPQLDFTTKCLNYFECVVPRDSYNKQMLMANPGFYYDFDEYGIASNGRNGGEGQMPVMFSSGEVREVYGWYYFMREDQQAVIDTSRVDPQGGVSSGTAVVTRGGVKVGNIRMVGSGPSPLYNEGVSVYSNTGTATSPGWSRLQNDGESFYGGIEHPCSSTYVTSQHDAAGLTGRALQVVTAYNSCG